EEEIKQRLFQGQHDAVDPRLELRAGEAPSRKTRRRIAQSLRGSISSPTTNMRRTTPNSAKLRSCSTSGAMRNPEGPSASAAASRASSDPSRSQRESDVANVSTARKMMTAIRSE